MPDLDRKTLLQLLDDTRTKIECLLPQIDPNKEIYPGWTIREVLVHVAGWDEAAAATLRAHLENKPLSLPRINNLDEYNAISISNRSEMDGEQVLREWRSTRDVLRRMIKEFPEEKFHLRFAVPWGGKSTVTAMMEMFCEHEESHTRDIQKVLQNQD